MKSLSPALSGVYAVLSSGIEGMKPKRLGNGKGAYILRA